MHEARPRDQARDAGPQHAPASPPPRPAEAGGTAPLRVWLLGGFRVAVGPRAVPDDAWERRKAAGLLKLLALAPERRLHREQALEALWPALAPEAAANNLHHTLHVARQLLEPARPPAAPSAYLALHGDLLVLCPAATLWTDVAAFTAAAGAARAGRDPAAHEAALRLYAGELLPEDRYEDWTLSRREALCDLALALLLELVGLYEGRGDLPAALAACRRALASEPAHEEAHVALMRLYALSGERGRALRQYQQLREALRRDLDVDPAPAAQRLYRQIWDGRFPARPAGEAAPAARAAPPTNRPAEPTSFVGRERELADLARLLDGGA
ncbi:MAG TPA: BTAD domain-containing putative transcriptional regulator, partial [Thermomicrobiales bacterium]|nr:BTAD domain-containing putative transcriptional regulator [Thermomicrobiales bacterium]